MTDDEALPADRARELIEQLDTMRRESETIRARIEDAMHREQERPFWPERRRAPRGLTGPPAAPAADRDGSKK